MVVVCCLQESAGDPVCNLYNHSTAVDDKRGLGPKNRCLVSLDRFAEPRPGKGAGNARFEVTGDRPAVFAGVRVPEWTCIRKLKDSETTNYLFAFLTCQPNGVVAPIHPLACPAH